MGPRWSFLIPTFVNFFGLAASDSMTVFGFMFFFVCDEFLEFRSLRACLLEDG